MNFGNIVIMMSRFGAKSGDFAQRGVIMMNKLAQSQETLRSGGI